MHIPLETLTLNIPGELLAEALMTLASIFLGTLAALATNRRNEQRQRQRRARLVLRSLLHELGDNHKTLRDVKSAFASTAWGRSFYLSTTAWETALAGGDLPAVVGFELADLIAAQYALFVRIRYYVDLLTQLWLAPADIQGYEEIRAGFRQAIVGAMGQALDRHARLVERIREHPAAAALD